MNDVQLSALRRKGDYYRNESPEWVRTVWARPQGFDWFIKHHRTELATDGAIIRLGRDWFIDVDQFPVAAKRILGVEVAT